ncbi:MAG: YajG family lipoprotein [Pseudomonadota bacterium]
MKHILWLCCFLAACTTAPLGARINPYLDVERSQIGAGRHVSVAVIDARADRSLGEGPVEGFSGDAVAALRDALAEGLRRQGYDVTVQDGMSGITLTLLELKYRIEPESLVQTRLAATAVVKATVRHRGGSYENTYRAAQEERDPLSPSANDVERMLNGTLSDILARILRNDEVRAALARQ